MNEIKNTYFKNFLDVDTLIRKVLENHKNIEDNVLILNEHTRLEKGTNNSTALVFQDNLLGFIDNNQNVISAMPFIDSQNTSQEEFIDANTILEIILNNLGELTC